MKTKLLQVCFFNNCQRRDHVGLFGQGAFFDLGTTGRQGSQATGLQVGQSCVVATTTPGGSVEFNWYLFRKERTLRDEHGAPDRVFFGKFVASESLSKHEAARNEQYSIFFDRNGNFKQGSVFQGDIPQTAQPKLKSVDPDADESYPEGKKLWKLHQQKERNQKAVKHKKEKMLAETGKLECEVCDFDFAQEYGVLGYGFAECHHRVPLAHLKTEHRVRISELAIVCANCHRMLHRKPLHTPEELRRVVLGRRC